MPATITTPTDGTNSLKILQEKSTMSELEMRCAALVLPHGSPRAPAALGAKMMCTLSVIDDNLAKITAIREQLLSIIEEEIT